MAKKKFVAKVINLVPMFLNVHGSIGCVICWMDDEWMCESIEHDSVITQFSGSW
jgi:hypothetical protein